MNTVVIRHYTRTFYRHLPHYFLQEQLRLNYFSRILRVLTRLPYPPEGCAAHLQQPCVWLLFYWDLHLETTSDTLIIKIQWVSV